MQTIWTRAKFAFVLPVAGFLSAVVFAGCGGGGDSSGSNTDSIMRSVRAYFVFDRSPGLNLYCRSFVSVRDQHTFRQGTPADLIRGRTVSPHAIVARISDGDWRVLRAGYE